MRSFNVPTIVKNVNNKLNKLGFNPMSYRSTMLLGNLAKQGLYNASCVGHWMARNGAVALNNSVTSWLNVAPSNVALNQSLVQGTTANMPILLMHDGSLAGQYEYFRNDIVNYSSTPDSVPLSFTGDIEIIARVAMDNWTAGAAQQIITKRQTAGQYSWQFSLSTGNVLRLDTSPDGTTSSSASGAAPAGATNGQPLWVRVTRVASTGIVTFYTAPDSVNIPTVWTINAITSNTAGNIFDSTSEVAMGAILAGTQNLMAGKTYRVQVYNGLVANSGVLALDANFATYVSGTTFTDSSSNGATITLNGGATVVTVSCLYFDGVNDYMKTGAFTLGQPTTVYFVGRQVTWTSGRYFYDGIADNTLAMFQQSATPNRIGIRAPTAAFSLTTPSTGVLYVIGAVFNGASSILQLNNSLETKNGDAGTNAAGSFTLGTNGGLGNYGNITVTEILIYNTAHNTAQQNAIINYLMTKYSL